GNHPPRALSVGCRPLEESVVVESDRLLGFQRREKRRGDAVALNIDRVDHGLREESLIIIAGPAGAAVELMTDIRRLIEDIVLLQRSKNVRLDVDGSSEPSDEFRPARRTRGNTDPGTHEGNEAGLHRDLAQSPRAGV